MVSAPAVVEPCGSYSAYTARPNNAQTARYDPANSGAASARPLVRTNLETAGTAPGSIIAAIIGSQAARKNENEPSSVAAPMSMPLICRIARNQQAPARPRVAVTVALVLVISTRDRTAPRNSSSEF